MLSTNMRVRHLLSTYPYLLLVCLYTCVAASVIDVRQGSAVDPNGPITGWSTVGCYIDHAASRTLRAASSLNSSLMTPAVCTSFCADQGKGFAGVEDGKDCWCDGLIQMTGAIAPSTDCDSPCSGDPNLLCGGPSRLEIFTDGSPSPAIVTGVLDGVDLTVWAYVGCYSDSPRVLSRQVGSASTVDACISLCAQLILTTRSFFSVLAGIENGNECWCDTASANLTDVQSQRLPDIACESIACPADQSKACGGPLVMALYQQPTEPEEASNFRNSVCFNGRGSPPQFALGAHFGLSAVMKDEPNTVFPINLAVLDPSNTINGGSDVAAVILSACPTCTQPPLTFVSAGDGFEPLYVEVDPSIDLTGGFPITTSPGGTTNFLQVIAPYEDWGMGGYCAVPNPLDSTGQTFAMTAQVTNKYPTILTAVQTTVELDLFAPFSLCANNTADGRLDVVWKGVEDQLGFDLGTCSDIVLVVNFE